MAIHTAIALLLLNTGILAVRQTLGLVELLISDTASGRMARSLLISAPLLVLGIGGALLVGERLGYYDNRLSLALMATQGIVTFVAVTLNTGQPSSLDR